MTDRGAAYGGEGWSPRTKALRDEIGEVWARCGQASEWGRLRSVLLHRPGRELAGVSDPNAAQMLQSPDPERAQRQHEAMAEAYEESGVTVRLVEPAQQPPPNLMFVADLVFMTPEGAVLARPASTVRAGEERLVAARLASLGIPILRSVRGTGTFEGADAAWLDPKTVLIGRGLRTNDEGAAQVRATLDEMGVEVLITDLPRGSMHLMGLLRFPDSDLAVAWPGRLGSDAVQVLRSRGYEVLFLPEGSEGNAGLNFVTLAPRRILMSAGCPRCQEAYEEAGIACRTVAVDELRKAAGGIGCLTGVLERELPGAPR
jgi:N-dimethylarginine dimethylaminohydrolase